MSAKLRSTLARRSAVVATSVLLSTSVLLGTSGIASADPYDDYDDGGSYSYSEPDYSYSEPDFSYNEPDTSYSEPDYSYSEPDPEPVYSEPEPEPAYQPEPEQEPVYEPETTQDTSVPDDFGADAWSEPDSQPAADPAPEAGADPGTDLGTDTGSEDMSGFDLGMGADDPNLEDMSDLDLSAGLPDTADVTTPQIDSGDVAEEDLDLTKGVPPTVVDPEPASSTEVAEFSQLVESSIESSSSVSQSSWSSAVSQWDSRWVTYDNYYRPIITNPYRTPLQLLYTYDNFPRIVTVAPLQSVALTAGNPGVYNFTALTRPASGAPAKVSAGSFSGGGYIPAPGKPMPAKPAALQTFQNVLVQLKYTNQVSKPFRVKQLIDLGDDPQVGAHKVLLDEETPAWGHWVKAANGERMFEITKSQELPGVSAPSESPLPGYDVALVNNEVDHGGSWTTVAVVAAAGCGVLGLAAVALFLFLGRRRPGPQ